MRETRGEENKRRAIEALEQPMVTRGRKRKIIEGGDHKEEVPSESTAALNQRRARADLTTKFYQRSMEIEGLKHTINKLNQRVETIDQHFQQRGDYLTFLDVSDFPQISKKGKGRQTETPLTYLQDLRSRIDEARGATNPGDPSSVAAYRALVNDLAMFHEKYEQEVKKDNFEPINEETRGTLLQNLEDRARTAMKIINVDAEHCQDEHRERVVNSQKELQLKLNTLQQAAESGQDAISFQEYEQFVEKELEAHADVRKRAFINTHMHEIGDLPDTNMDWHMSQNRIIVDVGADHLYAINGPLFEVLRQREVHIYSLHLIE